MCAATTSGAAASASLIAAATSLGVIVHRELHEHGEPEAELLAVEDGAVAGDHAGLLERAQAAQARGRRQVQPLGERGVGDPALVLQDLEHPAVNAVQGQNDSDRGRFGTGYCAAAA